MFSPSDYYIIQYPHCSHHFLKGIARERRKLVQRILELGLPFIIVLLPNEEGFTPEKEVLNTAPLHETVNVCKGPSRAYVGPFP